jgi:DNA polymerase-3 subunit alpha
MVARTKELGMPALALTDHGNMFGAIEFFKAAKEEGIKPIIGIEAYLAARTMQDRDSNLDRKSTHLLLLAENQAGYQNLLKIATASQLEGFYYFPRIDHEFLEAHSDGLIATSGCIAAEIPQAILKGNSDRAQRLMDWYFDVFGPDRFFLEMQDHDIPDLKTVNRNLIELKKRYQGKIVATNDVHYIDQADRHFQDILLCVQTSSLLSEPNRMRMTESSYYLRTPEEMAELFSEFPDAIENTLLIAERCEVNLDKTGYHLPEFEVPGGRSTSDYLRELCEEGLPSKYGDNSNDDVIRNRLEYELGIIHEMGFDAYFLIVWDLCRFAREQGIWYNARGSAAGSVVAYVLNITLVNPLDHGLIFERFLNPDRLSMPDIDLDFEDDKRYKIMEYCAGQYGEDKVAAIITFGKLKARAAVRDVGRVLDIPLSEVDKIAKMIPNIPGNPVTIQEALDEVPELKIEYQSKAYVRELIETAKKMEGVVRNVGTHAAGVVVTDKPIVEYIPLHRPTGVTDDTSLKSITQFEMSVVDDLGLLKIDFLGLSTLTIMSRACALIKERHGIDLNLHNIPLDDPKTFDLLGNGYTAGVFQLEGVGMTRWVREMKPKTLSNVIAMVALFRPGPMVNIPSYINRMHKKEKTAYLHPALEPILNETYGITVYQEQIMYTAMNLAGYSASEADILRKGVAKKKEGVLLEQRQRFVSGAVEREIPEDIANKIFDGWEAFARYGFPKGHAADYAVIAVETAYLKANFPLEFMTALLSVSKSDTGKVASYINDCRRMGIEVLPPDVCSSDWDFTIEEREKSGAAIHFGLGGIKNVGFGPVEAIIEARKNEDFTGLVEFARQVDLRHVGRRALESLIRVGAMDCFGSRHALLQVIDRVISLSTSHFQAAEIGQISFFGVDNGIVDEIDLPVFDSQFDHREQLNWEKELIGVYVSDHPLNPMMEQLEKIITHYAGELSLAGEKERVRVAGIVTRIRPHQTKKGDPMGFVQIEDIQGVIDLVVFPRPWEQCFELLAYDNIIIVEGKVDAKSSEPKILVDQIRSKDSIARSRSTFNKKRAQENLALVNNISNGEDTVVDTADDSESINQVSEQPEKYSVDKEIPPPPDPFPPDWESNGEASSPQSETTARLGSVRDSKEVNGGSRIGLSIGNTGSDLEKTPVQESMSNKDGNPLSDYPTNLSTQDEQPSGTDMDDNIYPTNEEEIGGNGDGEEIQDRVEEHTTGGSKEMVSDLPESIGLLDSDVNIPGYILPAPGPEGTSSRNPQMIRVVIRSGRDGVRDILRLRRIYGVLISYPGNDSFSLYVIEGHRGYLLEFPNDSTGDCEELRTRLMETAGVDNIRIEPITFQ